MTDERFRLPDSSKDRFAEAVTEEVSRRFDIYPQRDESRAVADLHARIAGSPARVDTAGMRGYVPEQQRRSGAQRLWHWGWPAGALSVALLAFFAISSTRSVRDIDAARTYTTKAGQQLMVTLRDSTQVTLAPLSTMRVLGFNASRQIELEGQAYFEAAHHGKVPLTIKSGSATTRVLGTAFMVRHYASDSRARIAVAEGKVAVEGASGARSVRTLSAGDVGEVVDSTVKVTTIEDLAAETGWLHGKLVFHGAPISEVLGTLQRWYGYEFRITDSTLAHQSVTVALSTSSSAEALSVLKKLLSASLTISGDTVTFTPLPTRQHTKERRGKAYDVWTTNREVGR